MPETESELLLSTANRLGIPLSRMQTVEEGASIAAALKPVAIEDLLFRPSVEVDRAMLADLLHGKRAIVTGGGGSIGSEICARLIAFGVADLLILDHSEPALYNILRDAGPALHRLRRAVGQDRRRSRPRPHLLRCSATSGPTSSSMRRR